MIQFVVPLSENGGVFDFACRLQEAFGARDASMIHLSKDTVDDWRAGPDDTVILQMSGYGFSKRGVPLWLLNELEKRRKHIATLGVFFHELYALGPPWSSSFWLSPVQRRIARRLAELSDFWMTSREGSAQWLERFAGDKPHAVQPVFSTIGEPDALSQARLPKVILFGSPGLRQATYLAAGDKLFAWAENASLEIHDIGAPVADQQLAEILRAKGVVLHGRLDDESAREVMADAMFGLLAYPVDYVAKSSVFAAYCAHGVCPVLFSKSYVQADGLVAGTHFLKDVPESIDINYVASIREAAWAWYQAHDLGSHFATLNKFILPLMKEL